MERRRVLPAPLPQALSKGPSLSMGSDSGLGSASALVLRQTALRRGRETEEARLAANRIAYLERRRLRVQQKQQQQQQTRRERGAVQSGHRRTLGGDACREMVEGQRQGVAARREEHRARRDRAREEVMEEKARMARQERQRAQSQLEASLATAVDAVRVVQQGSLLSRQGRRACNEASQQRVMQVKQLGAAATRAERAHIEGTLEELHQMEVERVRAQRMAKTVDRAKIEEIARDKLLRGLRTRSARCAEEGQALERKKQKKEGKLARYEDVFNECFFAGVEPPLT